MGTNYIDYIFHNDFSLSPIVSSFDWVDWLFFCLSIISLLVSRLINFDFLTTFFNNPPEYFSTNKVSVFSLSINFVLTSSFFLKHIISINTPAYTFFNQNSLLAYLILFSSISLIILIKFLILYLLRIIFNSKVSFTIYYHLKYYQLIGLLALPLFILTYFVKSDIKIYFFGFAFIIYYLLIILREIEIFLTALKQKVSLLYIILYLCTLEILPLILIIKILIG